MEVGASSPGVHEMSGLPNYSVGWNLGNEVRKNRFCLAWVFNRLCLFEIDRLPDYNKRNHSHAVVRRAFHSVNAFGVQRDCDLLAYLALEGFRAVRDHAFDGFSVVPLVGRYESDGVAGSRLHEVGLKNHGALFALVEHLDLMVRSLGTPSDHQCSKTRCDNNYAFHCDFFHIWSQETSVFK